MVEIIKIHYKVSRPVARYQDIEPEVKGLLELVERDNKAYAIAHAQVSETPYTFFVLAKRFTEGKDKMFESQIIMNPKILEAPLYQTPINPIYMGTSEKDAKLVSQIPNALDYREGCMSFPYKGLKRVRRYDQLKVQYQVKGRLWGLKTITRQIEGIASEVFQHEFDHCEGKNIYYES